MTFEKKIEIVEASFNVLLEEKSIWKDYKDVEAHANFSPRLRQALDGIKPLENLYGRLDWDKLEGWTTMVLKNLRESSNNVAKLGFQMPTNLSETTAEKMMEISELRLELLRVWGPNWQQCLEEIQLLNPTSNPNSIQIDNEKLQLFISTRSSAIFGKWATLQGWKSEGKITRFQNTWAKIPGSHRRKWLQEKYPSLPSQPHPDAYIFIQDLAKTPTNRKAFLGPKLNIEDLCRGEVLSEFLATRATFHPRFFRSLDGRSVPLGVMGGYLKPANVPNTILTFESNDDEYCVRIDERPTASGITLPSNANEERPGDVLLQLEAQQHVYDFLTSCLERLLDDEHIQVVDSQDETHTTEYVSLLSQSLGREYGHNPGTIDLAYLENLLHASLDEAEDELWQLRQDAEHWAQRLEKEETLFSGPRVENMLRDTFTRVSIFHTLVQSVDVIRETFRNDNINLASLSQEGKEWQLLISLDDTCLAILQEQLERLQRLRRAPNGTTSTVLSTLLEMIKSNDAKLRIIRFPAFLRVLDGEIQQLKETQERTPLDLMKTLDDMSVLAACLLETSWRCFYIPDTLREIEMRNQAEAMRREDENAWELAIKKTLEAMGDESRKLSISIHDKKTDVRGRHQKFWITIDNYMRKATVHDGLLDYIQQKAPIKIIPVSESNKTPDWGIASRTDPVPTPAKKRDNSVKKEPVTSASEQSVKKEPVTSASEPIPQTPVLPLVTPQKNRDFWEALLAPSSENDTNIRWCDFEKAMQGIGYTMIRQGGSGRRFVSEKPGGTEHLGTIVFHEPHTQGGKVSHREAQQWWLRRLQKRFLLELGK